MKLGELVTRGGSALRWFAAVRRVPFNSPQFTRSLPVDVVPRVMALDGSLPPKVLHPEIAARWTPAP